MIIETLICRMDGTQELVRQELPDDFFLGTPPVQDGQQVVPEQATE